MKKYYVERLLPLEEKYQIELNATAYLVDERIEISCEAVGNLQSDIDVVAAAYNEKGEVISVSRRGVYAEEFEGITGFTLHLAMKGKEEAAWVRVYPKQFDYGE